MSLSCLHQHLLTYTRKHSTLVGSKVLNRWSRADEVHAQAVCYLQAVFRGSRYNVDRIALMACQDLVNLKLISMQDSSQYKVFKKSARNFVFIHAKAPKGYVRTKSGLNW